MDRVACVLLAIGLSTPCLSVGPSGDLDLSSYRGSIVYLDFWASWCQPCRESFRWMNSMQAALRPKGFTVLGVNVDQDRHLAEKFLQDNPANFPVVYDPRGAVAEAFGVTGMPTSILIDRDGRHLFQHTGFSQKQADAYEAQILDLLSHKST